MLFYFLCISATLASLYSTVNLQTFRQTFDTPGEIEIDIRTFNYYIIFIEIPLNSTLTEYRSNNELKLKYYDTFNIYDIDLYRYIEYPFAKQVIKISTGGTVSFAYGSLQDMCSTGIIMTNYEGCTFVLSQHFSNYTKLGKGEDKCIIYTNPSSTQMYLLDLSGLNGRIILYQNGEAYLEWSGTGQKYTTVDASKAPVILRVMTDPVLQSDKIRIAMGSYACIPYRSMTYFWENNVNHCGDLDKCSLYNALHVDIILIVIASIVCVAILFSITYYIATRTWCKRLSTSAPQEGKSAVSISTTEKGENRTVPTGYYVMAPILGMGGE